MSVEAPPTSGMTQTIVFPDWKKNPLGPKHHWFYTSNAYLTLTNGGRYGGKDHVCALRGLRLAHELWAKNRHDYPHEGACVEMAVLGGVQRQADTVWDKMLKQIPEYGGVARNGLSNKYLREKAGEVLLFGDGIKISFLPVVGDGSDLVAPGYDIIIVTEAAFLRESAVRDYIKPLCVRPGYAGYLMLNSTPENNWWDHAVNTALTKTDETGRFSNYLDWEAHWFTSFDNPKLEARQLKDILSERDNNYQRFRRRYLGDLFVEIPTDAGSLPEGQGIRQVFQADWLERCYVFEPLELRPPFRIFLDIAWTERGDQFAVVILDANNYVADIEVHRMNSDVANVVRHLERLNRDWHQPLMGYDAQGRAALLAPHVQGRGFRIRAVTTPNAEIKGKRVETAANLIRQGKVLIPHPDRFPFMSNRMRQNVGKLRRELLEFIGEYKQTARGGYWFYGKPSGSRFSDDIADALIGGLNLTMVSLVDTEYDTLGV